MLLGVVMVVAGLPISSSAAQNSLSITVDALTYPALTDGANPAPTATDAYRCPWGSHDTGSGATLVCTSDATGALVTTLPTVIYSCPTGYGATSSRTCETQVGAGTIMSFVVECRTNATLTLTGRTISCAVAGVAASPRTNFDFSCPVGSELVVGQSSRICDPIGPVLVDSSNWPGMANGSNPIPVAANTYRCPPTAWETGGSGSSLICEDFNSGVVVNPVPAVTYSCPAGFGAAGAQCEPQSGAGTLSTLSATCGSSNTMTVVGRTVGCADGDGVPTRPFQLSQASCPFWSRLSTSNSTTSCANLENPIAGPAQAPLPTNAGWLETLNWHRAGSGLPPVGVDTQFSADIAAHLNYLDRTPAQYFVGQYTNVHLENPASPYYSEAGVRGGAVNLNFDRSSDRDAVESWLVAPFHATSLLSSVANATAGYSRDSDGRAGLGLRGGSPANPDRIVVFPGVGSETHLRSFAGGESPSALPTCGYSAPVGLPIQMILPAGSTFHPDVDAVLTDESGRIVESCVVSAFSYVSSNPAFEGPGLLDSRIFIIPRSPLSEPWYRVRVTQPGVADVAWSFSVTGNGNAMPPMCLGREVTVITSLGEQPTNADDVILGTTGNDVIRGLGGDDVICGNGGTDVLYGDDGDDTIHGAGGNDVINGGAGADTISGGAGSDIIDGGDSGDEIDGGVGDDRITGGNGWDRISAGPGDDTVFGGFGNDWVWAGPGNDSVNGGVGDDLLLGFDGDDIIFAGGGNDKMNGMNGDDTINAGDGGDQVWGGLGDDTIYAGSGFDWVWGFWGEDTIYGGHGNDSIFGEGHNDILHGGPGSDVLDGALGDDSLSGDAGNDTISGGDSNDTLSGGAGNDALHGDAGVDDCNGGGGTDSATDCETKENAQ